MHPKKEHSLSIGELVYRSADCWLGDDTRPRPGLVVEDPAKANRIARPYAVLWGDGKIKQYWAHDLVSIEYHNKMKKKVRWTWTRMPA